MVLSRFAPAPTGLLHLGHVVNAIYVWGLTKPAGGRVLLRIEDHDRLRCRREFEVAILDDLEWLGFVPDDPPIAAFRSGPCDGRQSDRDDVYESALAILRTEELVYACECSRSEIAPRQPQDALSASKKAVPMSPRELRYPGTCATKNLPERPGRGLRVRLAPSVERFDDLRHGPLEQLPSEQCGDLLVKDRDGHWTYQFCAAVDDHVQGITLVVRGDDLLASSGRQLQLARLLGRRTPARFFHHPLVMKSPTQKLSKADRDTSVRDLRAAGFSAADVIGQAAAAARLMPTARPLDVSDVQRLPLIPSLHS